MPRPQNAFILVEQKPTHFDPSRFDDRYEDALKDLLKKKQEGRPIERPERREPTNNVKPFRSLCQLWPAADITPQMLTAGLCHNRTTALQ